MNFIIVSPNLLSWPCCVFFFSSSTAYTHFNLSPACTFLGPSRKRGPPKGYIDAIEARLHQTEALLGIMIGSNDERARTLLEDLSKVCHYHKLRSRLYLCLLQCCRTLSPKR